MEIKRKLVAGAAAALAVGGAGAGIAATQLNSSPSAESKAIVNDAAKQLGVDPTKLSDALKKALTDRIDAAVEQGKITKEEGEALKKRIQSDEFPLFGAPAFGFRHFGFGGPGPHGLFHGLDSAATYLGLSEAQLRTQLNSGKSLAQIAKSKGKSVDGLEQALKKDAQEKLDAIVKDGKLSKADEQKILQDLDQRIDDLVNGQLRLRFRGGHGFRGFRGFPGRPRQDDGPHASFPGPFA